MNGFDKLKCMDKGPRAERAKPVREWLKRVQEVAELSKPVSHTPVKADGTLVEDAAFALESIGHLQGLEQQLLPLAEHLREIAKAAKTSELPIDKLEPEDRMAKVIELVNK